MPTHLLVIEDEEQIRKNIVDILRLSGFEVTSAANGIQGITLALHHRPDLILCDIRMPEMDGYHVLQAIRTNPLTDQVPFIFLTAKADMVDLRRGMVLGADDYLTKPFRAKDLLAAIESRLKRQHRKPVVHSPAEFRKTIWGHNEKGNMILATDDCLYFFVLGRQYFVRHHLGTFQIDLTLEQVAKALDPAQFFRINRQAILHRKTVRNVNYWEKGKYCLVLALAGRPHEVTLSIARFHAFKAWLSVQTQETTYPSTSSHS